MTFCKLGITHSPFEKVSESEFLSTDFSRRENEVVFDAFRTEKPQLMHTKPRERRFLGRSEIVTAARNGQQNKPNSPCWPFRAAVTISLRPRNRPSLSLVYE